MLTSEAIGMNQEERCKLELGCRCRVERSEGGLGACQGIANRVRQLHSAAMSGRRADVGILTHAT